MTSLKPSPDVVVEEQEGEAFLLDTASGCFFSLNATGLLAWNAIVAGREPVDALVAAFPHVERSRLEGDVRAVVDELLAERLLTEG